MEPVDRAELPTIQQADRRVGSRQELRAFDLLLSNDFDAAPSKQMRMLQHQTRTSRQFQGGKSVVKAGGLSRYLGNEEVMPRPNFFQDF